MGRWISQIKSFLCISRYDAIRIAGGIVRLSNYTIWASQEAQECGANYPTNRKKREFNRIMYDHLTSGKFQLVSIYV